MSKKIYIFLAILFFISLIGITWLWKNQYPFPDITKYHPFTAPAPTLSPTFTPIPLIPTPTLILITPNPTEQQQLIEQNKNSQVVQQEIIDYEKRTPLLTLMPVIEQDFRIDYLGNSQYLVTILSEDKISAKDKVYTFWKSHDVDPNSINLTWK